MFPAFKPLPKVFLSGTDFWIDSVKAILVHRAHRLLSESTLILRTVRRRPSSG